MRASPRRSWPLVAVAVLSTSLTTTGAGQAPGRPADRAAVHRLVDTVASLVASRYVVPDTGRMIAEHLRQRLGAGAYDRLMSIAQAADFLTADLEAVNGDLHLYVRPSGASSGGPVMRFAGPPDAAALEAARRENFNVQRADHLDGNVGYLAVSLLSGGGSDEVFNVIDQAMAFLQRSDAMIIDLRNTPGGEPRVCDYLASYFFGEDSVPLLASYSRSTDRTQQRFSRSVGGRKRPDVPVYVLIGPGSASGAEDFAFTMQRTGRGVLVGERTAGAGRLTVFYPAGDGLIVSIPGGRTYDPRTKAEWERVGVRPDIAAPSRDALSVAYAAALDTLGGRARDSLARRNLGVTRRIVMAQLRPTRLSANAAAAYAGHYDLRSISVEDGQLQYRRDDARPPQPLVPLGGDSFGLWPSTLVSFERVGGKIAAMVLSTPDGQVARFPRASPRRP